MVDTMKELQSMLVRWKAPMVIIRNCCDDGRPMRDRMRVLCPHHKSRPRRHRLWAISQLPEFPSKPSGSVYLGNVPRARALAIRNECRKKTGCKGN